MKELMRRNEIEIPTVKGDRVEKLYGTIFVPEGNRDFPGVVFYHGRSSSERNYLPIGEELARNGIAALAFNFSTDVVSERRGEAEEAYFYLHTHPQVDEEDMGILGVSMGADQASIMASQFNVRSLVLRAPAAYPETEDSGSIQAIRDFTGDLLIVQSEKDEVIPRRLIDLYFKGAVKAKRKEIYLIRGAGHFLGEADSPYRQEFKQIVVDWFRETMK